MIQIVLPDACRNRRLTFFLALEEWVAAHLPDAEYFFTWIVDPTVIIGRNQSLSSEVNVAYCREHGIDICRRRSGGGCVYADRNNLMISYVAPGIDVPEIFARYTAKVSEALNALGINSSVSGRNDILVDGAKVSGNAFYRLDSHSIVHGTMLWSVDFETMGHAITPSRAKLESKRVKSVESRVAGIAGLVDGMSLETFSKRLVDVLCNDTYVLTPEDVRSVEMHALRYHVPGWLEGSARKDSSSGRIICHRVEGVGEFDIFILERDGALFDIDLRGDFFCTTDPREFFNKHLVGCPLNSESLRHQLARVDVSDAIPGLTNEALVEMISRNNN